MVSEKFDRPSLFLHFISKMILTESFTNKDGRRLKSFVNLFKNKGANRPNFIQNTGYFAPFFIRLYISFLLEKALVSLLGYS